MPQPSQTTHRAWLFELYFTRAARVAHLHRTGCGPGPIDQREPRGHQREHCARAPPPGSAAPGAPSPGAGAPAQLSQRGCRTRTGEHGNPAERAVRRAAYVPDQLLAALLSSVRRVACPLTHLGGPHVRIEQSLACARPRQRLPPARATLMARSSSTFDRRGRVRSAASPTRATSPTNDGAER